MNLAVTSPSASAYSETFLHMQMDRLPCRLRIHGGPVASETVPGGPIQPLRSIRGLFDTAYWRGYKKTRGWEGPQTAELKRRLIKNRIEVVLANYGPVGVALFPVCKALSIPLAVHFHGNDAHAKNVIEEHRENYRSLGRECAGIVVVSQKMKSALTDLGMPREKMTLVRYGVDPDRFEVKTEFPPLRFSSVLAGLLTKRHPISPCWLSRKFTNKFRLPGLFWRAMECFLRPPVILPKC